VAARKALSDAVIATGTPHLGRGNHGKYLIELRHVMGEVAGIRRMGSAALDLAYVAAGRFDGYWERDLAAWDIAAGVLLIREAGGWSTDIDGGAKPVDEGSIVCGNEYITKALRDVVHRPIPTKCATRRRLLFFLQFGAKFAYSAPRQTSRAMDAAALQTGCITFSLNRFRFEELCSRLRRVAAPFRQMQPGEWYTHDETASVRVGRSGRRGSRLQSA
jgi:hypothetical protein